MQVKVRVRTGAKEEEIAILPDGRLEVTVREKPKEGRANERVIELVARHFKVPATSVRILRGRTTASKLLAISAQ